MGFRREIRRTEHHHVRRDVSPRPRPRGCALTGMLLVVSLLATSTAAAGSRREHMRFGAPAGYLALGAGGATEGFRIDIDRFDPGEAVLINGRLGYRAASWLAVEASLDYTASPFRVDLPAPSGIASLESRALLGTGNLKLYAGDGRVQPYAIGGVGALYGSNACRLNGVPTSCLAIGARHDGVGFAGKVGGGLDILLTENVGLNGELSYVMASGELSGYRYLGYTGSVVFRF